MISRAIAVVHFGFNEQREHSLLHDGDGLAAGQPLGQLTVRADMAVDEAFQPNGLVTPCSPEVAQDFLCDGVRHILGPIGLGVEHHHTQRIVVLHAHQVGNGSLKLSAAKIGPANALPNRP